MTIDPAVPAGSANFVDRVGRALRLDAQLFEEIEHDPGALGQAAGVVALAALATGLGNPTVHGAGGILGTIIGACLGWLVATGFVWVAGVRMLGGTSNYPELLRTLGFAAAPQIAMVAGLIPVIGLLVPILVAIWGIAAYVIAVRQALDVTTGKAVVVCVLAFVLSATLSVLLGRLAGVV